VFLLLNLYIIQAAVLCNKFVHARDMVRETSLYYDQMSSTVPRALRIMWEAEVSRAESQRVKDPSVMDIIGARETRIDPSPDPIPSHSSRAGSDLQWLSLALSIEERQ